MASCRTQTEKLRQELQLVHTREEGLRRELGTFVAELRTRTEEVARWKAEALSLAADHSAQRARSHTSPNQAVEVGALQAELEAERQRYQLLLRDKQVRSNGLWIWICVSFTLVPVPV